MSRRWPLLLMPIILAGPLSFAQTLTVDQLTALVAASQSARDSELASGISNIQLSERISQDTYRKLAQQLPGNKSREALLMIADASTFVDPPLTEIPTQPAPDLDGQRAIMQRVVKYVGVTLRQLPNFFALRTTTRFEGWAEPFQLNSTVNARPVPPQFVATEKATVTYRAGKEQLSNEATRKASRNALELGLRTQGLFGPVLLAVLTNSVHGTLNWSRWERADGNTLAVFRFVVPMEKSTYAVTYCCQAPGTPQPTLINRATAYHGDMTVDPETGAIVRLRMMADLGQGDLSIMLQDAMASNPLTRADIMIEYAPVEIGGKNYTCPVRSVSISRARSAVNTNKPTTPATPGPYRNFINDVSFTSYHVFRSESRIITDGVQ